MTATDLSRNILKSPGSSPAAERLRRLFSPVPQTAAIPTTARTIPNVSE